MDYGPWGHKDSDTTSDGHFDSSLDIKSPLGIFFFPFSGKL